jgi:hypothetical protein
MATTDERMCVDLAANKPGQAVVARADELYAEWRALSFWRRLITSRTDRSWRQGAAGEARVAKQLSKLDDRFRVLHSIPVGTRGSDIDHLGIGPTGVFTINAKSHHGKSVWVAGDIVMINGYRQPHVRNSRYEARRVSRTLTRATGLEVPATALVIITGDKEFSVREQPKDGAVRVATPRAAVRWIKRQPQTLSVAHIDQLFGVARRSTTWAS